MVSLTNRNSVHNRGDNFPNDDRPRPSGNIYQERRKTIQETIDANVFTNTGVKENKKCLEVTLKITKIVVSLLSLVIVLGSSVISKGTLLFMTSQIKSNKKTNYCNKELGTEEELLVILPTVERVAWIWCLIFAFWIPQLGSFVRSARICIFKTSKKPFFTHFSIVFIMESLHTIGIAILVIYILPNLDVVKGAMLTNSVCFVPGVLGLLSRGNQEKFSKIIDLVAIAAQVTGFLAWPIIEQRTELWLIPASIFLVSCGWWENYISKDSSISFIQRMKEMSESMEHSRYFIYVFISTWKCICFFVTTVLIILINEGEVDFLFEKFSESFGNHQIEVVSSSMSDFTKTVSVDGMSAVYVFLINIIFSYIAYIFGKFACKIMIQEFSFAVPVNLTIPVSISLLLAACSLHDNDPCVFHDSIPPYLFFESPSSSLHDFMFRDQAWIWILWFLSQIWITLHIWTPKCRRLATTETLFVTPIYDGMLIDQSLAMNRRRYEIITTDEDQINYATTYENSDHITQLYACATMWHEDRKEMKELLKSILRLDIDQSSRKVVQEHSRIMDPDYYNLETHIFFDDAFQFSYSSHKEVNQFVKFLVGTIDEAASDVYQTNMYMGPPKRIPTLYGGRLIWTLPGKTKLIAHLKDKTKIRHKKRYSQVMYMYYLLGHKLMELPISPERKAVIAENTYLLSLDGDTDFHPPAVLRLIDLMKKNRNLGAACGHIHPVGSGPIVWWQLFEYKIGHWLQKATEHVLGCVLCSPGCFSLFRAKALMDDNVMEKYTTISSKPRHFLQYDQGEDRWLCTLLLQKGYRVEFCAASDAYTRAPEGFNEFYNQRRRWIPSGLATMLDLLTHSRQTIKINDNISTPYIIYQIILLAGAILGPGIVFLLLVQAFGSMFGIANWACYCLNLIPIILFILVCFNCKTNTQLMLAQILSCGYVLIMMAFVIDTVVKLHNESISSPKTIFLIATVGYYFITAFLHPQEFWCILAGVIYLLAIPTTFVLLILYSIINLNVVSWGTREIVVADTEEKKQTEETKTNIKQKSLFGFLHKCCTQNQNTNDISNTLMAINRRLEQIERTIDSNKNNSESEHHQITVIEEEEKIPEDAVEEAVARDDLVNPQWIEDLDLGIGEIEFLNKNEIQFWKNLINKYLYPLDGNKQEKARIEQELIELRNRSAFGVLMLNALFLLVVFMFQENKDQMYINWPFNPHTTNTYDEVTSQIHVTKEYLHVEPTGLVFMVFFGFIMALQFICMLIHRFGTFAHILATTKLNLWTRKKKPEDDDWNHDNTSEFGSKFETRRETEKSLQMKRKSEIEQETTNSMTKKHSVFENGHVNTAFEDDV